MRRLLQGSVTGVLVGTVFVALGAALYAGFLAVLVLASASWGGCQPFPDADECAGPPAQSLNPGIFGTIFSPDFGRGLLIIVLVIGSILLWVVATVTETLTWNGRRGWWWRGPLAGAPAVLGLFLAVSEVVSRDNSGLAGPVAAPVLVTLLGGIVFSGLLAGLLPHSSQMEDS
jgi:hypothetical protein